MTGDPRVSPTRNEASPVPAAMTARTGTMLSSSCARGPRSARPCWLSLAMPANRVATPTATTCALASPSTTDVAAVERGLGGVKAFGHRAAAAGRPRLRSGPRQPHGRRRARGERHPHDLGALAGPTPASGGCWSPVSGEGPRGAGQNDSLVTRESLSRAAAMGSGQDGPGCLRSRRGRAAHGGVSAARPVAAYSRAARSGAAHGGEPGGPQ